MPDIIVSPTNPDGPYCQIGNSGNNGTIWILPYGFQYSIDGGISWQANTHFLSLTAGVYNIVVKDTNGCQKTKKDTLINPNPIKPSILVTNVHGSVPGSIRIFQVYYGTPPFRFSINGGLTWRTDSLFTGLSGGIYYTITTQSTFNYCSQDTAIFVGIDPLLPVQVVAADSLIKCHGDSLGEIKIALLDSIHTARLVSI
jgi:hypothetical protein